MPEPDKDVAIQGLLSARAMEPLTWSRDERLRQMIDLQIERTDTYSLHEAVDGLHKGQWIASN